MWEAIVKILNSDKSIQVLIFLIILVLIIFIFVKKDFLKVHTSYVQLGTDEKERAIIRQQVEWTKNYVNGLFSPIMSKYPKIEPLTAKYVLECIYDEIIVWIMFNHISKSDMYIMVKADRLKGIVYSMNINKAIRTDEFAKQMDNWTKTIIHRLVDIREYYTKN